MYGGKWSILIEIGIQFYGKLLGMKRKKKFKLLKIHPKQYEILLDFITPDLTLHLFSQ